MGTIANTRWEIIILLLYLFQLFITVPLILNISLWIRHEYRVPTVDGPDCCRSCLRGPGFAVSGVTFCCCQQFMEWKAELEKTTTCSFVQHEAAKRRKRSTYHYFYCHRSGQSCKPSLPQHKRHRATKSQGD